MNDIRIMLNPFTHLKQPERLYLTNFLRTMPIVHCFRQFIYSLLQVVKMKNTLQMKQQPKFLLVICAAFFIAPLFAQDLDPRAYVRLPVKTTSLITGFSYSFGGVVMDPTIPIENIKAHVESGSLGVARSFSLFGLSSQALIALPYSWAQVSGDVSDESRKITRSGFGDMRMRIAVLFSGAPAATLAELIKAPPPKTILGASLNVVVPTGQFFSDKLINLGTNRWALRPELALSHPLGKRLVLDVYAGVWLFTNNSSFYPGDSKRTQDPMGTLQAHLSYNFTPLAWVAFDATYYYGGSSAIEGVYKDDRQANARFGITAVVPTGNLSSLKFSASTGAIVRVGQDFTSLSLGYQKSWVEGYKPPKKKRVE